MHSDYARSTFWSKWNPVYTLYNDHSSEAELLRSEMARLVLPFKVRNAYRNGSDRTWAWSDQSGIYCPPMWTVEGVLEKIYEDAIRYKKQLDSKP